jgi:hypothetical protein
MGKTKAPIQKPRPKSVIRKGLPESFPTAVQKRYFMLSDAERNVLNIGLQKYSAGQSEPILVGGEKLLKPALRLMSDYRLRIDEITGAEVVTSYTRWLASAEVREAENQEVYVAFSPQFERIWLESKKRLPEYVSQKPGNIRLRSQYALRLYGWAKKYVEVGQRGISLEQLRKVLGLDSRTRTAISSKKRRCRFGQIFAKGHRMLRYWSSTKRPISTLKSNRSNDQNIGE